MNLECPKCGYKFSTNATVRPHCPKCRAILPRIKTLVRRGQIGTNIGTNGTKVGTNKTNTIQDDIMQGGILDAHIQLKEKYEQLKKRYKKLQERIKSTSVFNQEYISTLADARSDVSLRASDSPFEAECVVCAEIKPILGVCNTCWDCLRKALELKTDSREGWSQWGCGMRLDLKPLHEILSKDKEGKVLLLKAVCASKDRNDNILGGLTK